MIVYYINLYKKNQGNLMRQRKGKILVSTEYCFVKIIYLYISKKNDNSTGKEVNYVPL